ncbi:STAS domain-containing protein [Pseudomonas sp. LS44]|uniref:STAS domain-containing protein n=1 Tax=Pseudomonas sp. LS44 TaxID=1357074 RepID=UPI00215AFEC8|nr:STAS domain-containing protein [Pseudomonas sp. LS44]UVE15976.1 STAS domain-containing protein [Pseudomonas sp. LS44]
MIDYSGLAALGELNRSLLLRDVKLHLAEVKGPIMDRLQHSELLRSQLSGELFSSTTDACRRLYHANEDWQ